MEESMKDRPDYYYTFRQTDDPNKWDALKWDEMNDEVPTITYVVEPFFGGYRGACSCPAWRQCKHIKCVQFLLQSGRHTEAHMLRWTEKGGWQEIGM